jgi:hypothetical protein
MFDILCLRCLNTRHLISKMRKFQIKDLFTFSSLRYKPVFISDEKVIFESEVARKTAVCPVCKKSSRHKHSHYTRVIRDLPICGKQTYIHLKTRRFVCRNGQCKRSIFSNSILINKIVGQINIRCRKTPP